MSGNPATGPSVRVGNIDSLLQVLGRLGIDAPALLAASGLSEDFLKHTESRLSLYTVDRLFTEAEKASGCDHVGLLVGMEVSDLGMPWFLMANAPDMRTGIRDISETIRLIHEGGSIALHEVADVATVRYSNVAPMLKGAHHISDCALAQMHQALTRYTNGAFKAERILLPRRPPADVAAFRAHYGAPVDFNADAADIQFSRRLLDYSSENANPALYRFLKSRVPILEPKESLQTQVRRAISFLLLEGNASADKVAQALGMNKRTLQRLLGRQEGASLQKLTSEVRLQGAKELLSHTDLSNGQIAMALGYSDASAFSRHFARSEGLPPGEFRKRNAT